MLTALATPTRAADSLPSWNEGASKSRIVAFVQSVTDPTSEQYVPPAERIAVFDNDGTLWVEQPMYVQAFFIMDRIRALAPQRPEWKDQEPFCVHRDNRCIQPDGWNHDPVWDQTGGWRAICIRFRQDLGFLNG